MFKIIVKAVNEDTRVYKDIVDIRKLSDGDDDYCDRGDMGRYWMRDTEGNIRVIELTAPTESITITRNDEREPDESLKYNTYPIFIAFSPEDEMWVATCPNFPLFSMLGKSRVEALEAAERQLVVYASVMKEVRELDRPLHAYQIKEMWEDAEGL